MMAEPKHQTEPKGDEMERNSIEKPGVTQVKEVNTASVALAAALAEQKPSLWSKSVLRLWAIMAIGYMISTINGFGKFPAI